jgi:hypothetical protein
LEVGTKESISSEFFILRMHYAFHGQIILSDLKQSEIKKYYGLCIVCFSKIQPEGVSHLTDQEEDLRREARLQQYKHNIL